LSARSYKRTPEVERRLLEALRVGSTFRLAAAYAGIDHATLYRWLEKDATLATRIKEAEGAAVVGWLAKIEKAASDGNWQAAAWKLERRYPEDFGRRERLDVRIDIEERVRDMARSLGLDEDEAVIEAQRMLGSGHAPTR